MYHTINGHFLSHLSAAIRKGLAPGLGGISAEVIPDMLSVWDSWKLFTSDVIVRDTVKNFVLVPNTPVNSIQ